MQISTQSYYQTFKALNPKMTAEEWAYFESGLVCKQYKPREFFIEADRRNNLLGFLTCGLIRGFYINAFGEDITTMFIKEQEFVTDYPSLLSQKPSRYSFQCLEPTTIWAISFDHIRAGYERFAGFERNGRLIAEEILKKQQQRIESFQFCTAEERYLDFVKNDPQLFNRVSLTHLSSYLGIERPSLSRIRKKILGV